MSWLSLGVLTVVVAIPAGIFLLGISVGVRLERRRSPTPKTLNTPPRPLSLAPRPGLHVAPERWLVN